jgi:hypothetical protein
MLAILAFSQMKLVCLSALFVAASGRFLTPNKVALAQVDATAGRSDLHIVLAADAPKDGFGEAVKEPKRSMPVTDDNADNDADIAFSLLQVDASPVKGAVAVSATTPARANVQASVSVEKSRLSSETELAQLLASSKIGPHTKAACSRLKSLKTKYEANLKSENKYYAESKKNFQSKRCKDKATCTNRGKKVAKKKKQPKKPNCCKAEAEWASVKHEHQKDKKWIKKMLKRVNTAASESPFTQCDEFKK